MGCCCFNTLRGAAFFAASVHIYNGLGHILTYVIFPVVFQAMPNNAKSHEKGFFPYLPGTVYSVLYFSLGCLIFRGIENESVRNIKWPAAGFLVVEITFFILRIVLGLIPTPTVDELSQNSQPFKWDIFKTLHYFIFTIVGGIVYLCILWLYIRQVTPDEDFSQYALPPEDQPSETAKEAPPAPKPASPRPRSVSPFFLSIKGLKGDQPHHVVSLSPKRGSQISPMNNNNNTSNTNNNSRNTNQTSHAPPPVPPPPEDDFMWQMPRLSRSSGNRAKRDRDRDRSPVRHQSTFCPPPEYTSRMTPPGCPPPPPDVEPHYQKIPLSPSFNYCLT